jgi:pyridoxal phosphate enzyme (YggS family)
MALGLREFGENRVQEAEEKLPLVERGVRWHLVGHLQTNKAKRAVEIFDEIHSVDSEHVAEELALRAGAAGRSPRCYVEVKTTSDEGKSGVVPSSAVDLLRRIGTLPPLRTVGLMTIGPLAGGADGARASFRMLARLRDDARAAGVLGEEGGLSMGMSDDFEIAIEEGATIVRIGTALFGDRRASRGIPAR